MLPIRDFGRSYSISEHSFAGRPEVTGRLARPIGFRQRIPVPTLRRGGVTIYFSFAVATGFTIGFTCRVREHG
jgi:hypothetical protein